MKKIGLRDIGLLCLIAAAAFSYGCGAAEAPPPEPENIVTLEGTIGIAIDATFRYEFEGSVTGETATAETFCLIAVSSADTSAPALSTPKAAASADSCSSSNKIEVSIRCPSPTACNIDPAVNLTAETSYTIYLTPGITYADGRSFEGFAATFTTGDASSAHYAPPATADIYSRILENNATGIRPQTLFVSIVLPEFGGSGTISYSVSDLPDWLPFDSAGRTLSLTGGLTLVPQDGAKSEITIKYTATAGEITSTIQFRLNDVDGDALIDLTEYKYGEVPLLPYIQLDPGIAQLYRPVVGDKELIPTAIVFPKEGLDLSDATDASADFDGDGIINSTELIRSTNIFVAASDGTFASAVYYVVGTAPSDISAADFDRDGDLDLAVSNSGTDNISILLGAGDGTFAEAVNYGVGDQPRSFAVGDFDGDGYFDLAVSNSGTDNISILLGAGDGTFAAAFDYATGSAPRAMTTADFDGDGDLDLATANRSGNDVSILLGSGAGTFGSAVNFAVGTAPEGMTHGDLNGDGRMDLIVTNNNSDNLSVLLGAGSGTFAAAVDYSTGNSPHGVVVGDFNVGDFDADEKLDIAVANADDDNVAILRGLGDGTFESAATYATADQPIGISSSDFNGDGKIDLATANGSGSISVLLSEAGTFGSAVYATNVGAEDVVSGDFDGDGDLDLAAVNRGGGPNPTGMTTSVFLNEGSGNAVD